MVTLCGRGTRKLARMSTARIRLTAGLGVLTISFTALLVRASDTAAVSIALYRALYSLPLLAVIWWRVRDVDRRPARSRALAFASGLFLAVDLALWHTSIERIGAGLATVLVSTQVVFVAAMAWLVHRERPNATALAVVPFSFAGVVLLSGLGRADAYGDDPWGGVLLGTLAGVFYALFILTLRASNRGHLAPTMGPILDSTAGMGVGALAIGTLTAADMPLSLPLETHLWLLALAVTSQVIGWPLINVALPRLAALETSALVLAQPMLTVIWALIIFDEDLSTVQWLGVLMVIGGLLVLNTRGAVHPRHGSGAEPAVDALGSREKRRY